MNSNLKSIVHIVFSSICILLIVGLFILFGFWLSFQSSAGVADAYNVTLPDDGVVGQNLLQNCSVSGFLGLSWNRVSSATYYGYSDFLVIKQRNSSIYSVLTQNLSSLTSGTYTLSAYVEVIAGDFALYVNTGSSTYYGSWLSVTDGLYLYTATLDVTQIDSVFTFMVVGKPGQVNNFNIYDLKLESGSSFTGFTSSESSFSSSFTSPSTLMSSSVYINLNLLPSLPALPFTYSSVDNVYTFNYFRISLFASSKNSFYWLVKQVNSVYVASLVADSTIILSFSLNNASVSSDYIISYDYIYDLTYSVSANISNNIYKYTFLNYYIQNDLSSIQSIQSSFCNNFALFSLSDFENVVSDAYYDSGYSAGQSAGYNSGYSAGQSAGYNSGYSVGQKEGYNSGYSAGHNDGVFDANTYSFLGLFGAVFDAPIKAFQGLLNFDILGFNMASFVTAIISLTIIILILKLVFNSMT